MYWNIYNYYYGDLSSITNQSSLLDDGLLTLGIPIIFIIALYIIYRFKNIRGFVLTNIKSITLLIFVSGIILYCIGFNEKGSELNLAALAFRSILSSMEMFVSHSDLIEVSEHLHEDRAYMTFFSLIHFLAVLISAVFVLRLLGVRFISWCRMYKDRIYPSSKKDRLYIFWEINDTSFHLAQSIVEYENGQNQKKNKYRIIFVEEPSKDHHQRLSFSHFFSSFFHDDGKLEKIEELNALITYSSTRLSSSENNSNLFISIGLNSLDKLITRALKIYFFFLSENENENIKSVLVMQNYISWICQHDKKELDIYCHARRNNENIMLENLSLVTSGKNNDSKFNVHIIDSSVLSVLSLKMDVNYHPVNFVKVSPSGTVTTSFISLIVGFGETGQDTLRFLYEFGSFPGKDGNKSPFKCYVMDSNMACIQGDFYMKVPALKKNKEIELIQCSCETSLFWEKMEAIISELNYIVISMGDDKKNISLAIKLYEFACRHRENNLERFKIFVRSYSMENYAQLKKNADYYNRSNLDSHGEIVIFGSTEEIFTYNVVINDETKENAKHFYYEYVKSRQGKNETALEDNPDKQWESRRNDLSIGMSNHQKLIQQEFQDFSNSWHIETKMRLASNYSIDEMLKCIHGRDKDSTVYPNADTTQKILLSNLAKCEHYRWNASNEMLGYVTYEITKDEKNKKDYIAKKLSCLVSYQRLEEVPALRNTICYDYSVVDVSFQIKKNKTDSLLKER